MSEPLRIGVYGGTFDPPHRTHLAIARAARDAALLDRVLFVVANEPPHKRGGVFASAEDRYAMVEAALAGEEGLVPCRTELDRPGPSYTADTLRALAAAQPDARWYLIVGSDSLADLPRWREPDYILAQARLLTAVRADQPIAPGPAIEGRYDVLPVAPTGLSSTEIRARIAAGLPVDDVLPPEVIRVIQSRGLYGACRSSGPPSTVRG